MPTILYLLRHGTTVSNIEQRYYGQQESALTDEGIKQAKELAAELSSLPFAAVYSSELSRSYDTALEIANHHGLKVQKEPGLRERNYGTWEKASFQDLRDKQSDLYEQWMEHPKLAKIPGAETLEQLQKRAVVVIERIIKEHEGKTIAVVGHGGVNRGILFHYLGLDLDNFWHIRQSNCCINIIEFGQMPRITLLNGWNQTPSIGVY